MKQGTCGHGLLFPSGLSRQSRDLSTFNGTQFFGAGFAAFSTASPTPNAFGMLLNFAYRVLGLTNGNVEYLLSKLDGIARTFGHETSMPQAAP
jgi:hypothetical protein